MIILFYFIFIIFLTINGIDRTKVALQNEN
jgi:hypothetical protein